MRRRCVSSCTSTGLAGVALEQRGAPLERVIPEQDDTGTRHGPRATLLTLKADF